MGAEIAPQWIIYTDVSSNSHAGGAGVVIQTLEGDEIKCMIRLDFPATNNEAEYEAVLVDLNLAKVAEASLIVIHSDSQVIIGYINGDYEAKGERMKEYLSMVKEKVSQ